MESRGTGLLVFLSLLAVAAGSVLVVDGRASPGRSGADFHRVVGGLGFGPALDGSDCPFGLDPRLDGACGLDGGPVPGGACFCPVHGGGRFTYRPLDTGEVADAPPD